MADRDKTYRPATKAEVADVFNPGGSLRVITSTSVAAVILLIGLLFPVHSASAQIASDSSFSWRGYSQKSSCLILILDTNDKDRPRAIVIKEIAENSGESITRDARYLVEQIGREHGIDPAKAFWFFRWGFYSFREARKSKKEVILRATFRRSKTGRLSMPLWRLASKEDIESLTR